MILTSNISRFPTNNPRTLSIVVCLFFFICIAANAQNNQNVERSGDWTAIYKEIHLENIGGERKFKLTGDAIAFPCKSESTSALWVRVNSDQEGMQFFDNMNDRPIISPNWSSYEINGSVNEYSTTITFGILTSGSGEYIYDNLKFYIEDESGDLQLQNLDNTNFDLQVDEQRIPGWSEGIGDEYPMNIREFSFESIYDNPKNNLSLLIKGIENISVRPPQVTFDTTAQSHVNALILMMDDLKYRVETQVKFLEQEHSDHLIDSSANSIAALVYHLAAAEVFYQVRTFENRGFNKEEQALWGDAMDLGEKGRINIRNKPIAYYLDLFDQVRTKTKEELKKRDDEWLNQEVEGLGITNYYSWFHVMEHQSSHLGQILFLKKRLPDLEYKG